MIVVEGMRLRKVSFLNTVILTNGFAFIMTIFNSMVGSNYWYLCIKPLSNSPFLIGKWPFYIVGIQFIGIILMGLIYIPWLLYFRRMHCSLIPPQPKFNIYVSTISVLFPGSGRFVPMFST